MTKALDSGAYHLDGEYHYVDESKEGAYFNGVSSHVDYYSAGLVTHYVGDETTIIFRAKGDNPSIWTDGQSHILFAMQLFDPIGWGSGDILIYKDTVNNQIAFLFLLDSGAYFLHTVPFNSLSWFTTGMTFSQSANNLKAYLDGIQAGVTRTPLSAWNGSYPLVNSCYFGASVIGSSNKWLGWMADGVLGWGTVASPAQMLSIHTKLNAGTLTTSDLNGIFGAGNYAWWKLNEKLDMTIWERVKTALADLGVPISANLHIEASGAELPDLFLVYFLVSSPPEQSADNRETLRSYRMQVSAYSRSGLIGLPNIDGAMVAAGFSRGPQRELPFNELTRHFGLALEYVYLEEE